MRERDKVMVLLTRSMRLLILALLLWTMAVFTARAAPDRPTWRQNLICEPAVQKYRGVEYCTGADGQVHVIVVDLHSPGVRLEYLIAQGVDRNNRYGECKDVNIPRWGPVRGGCADPDNPAYYPVMSLDQAVRRYPNAAAVIDSDYGAGTQDEPRSREHGPEGFTVVRGDRLDGPANGDTDNNAEGRPWLAVSRDVPLRAELWQFPKGQDEGSKPDWIYTGVGGAPWLVWDGEVVREQIRNCANARSGSCRPGVDQTAVGLSQDRRWLFLIVDVRKGQLLDTARFMRAQLDAWDAIKFDGGGSSQLWYGGLPANRRFVTRGDGRRLSQYLAVIAEPGSGIEDTAGALPLSARPTSPLFFDLVLPGETARIRIEVQNTGTVTWDPAQGIELRRVWKDVISPVVESYPLPHPVPPGETVAWDIELNTGGARFTTLRYRLYQGNTPFGPEIGAVVITLPEQLKGQEQRLREAIERELKEWQQRAEEELDRLLEEFKAWLLDLIRRELERQTKRWLDKICGSNAVLLVGGLLVALRRRRR